MDRETKQWLVKLFLELLGPGASQERAQSLADEVISQVNGHWICKLMRPDEVTLEDGIATCRAFVRLACEEP